VEDLAVTAEEALAEEVLVEECQVVVVPPATGKLFEQLFRFKYTSTTKF
jgi:hypothetical protein